MKLLEFEESDLSTGYYDPAEDKVERRELDDTRKPLLKLSDLNRLKKMRALKHLERLEREDLLSIMYGEPTAGSGPSFGGSPF